MVELNRGAVRIGSAGGADHQTSSAQGVRVCPGALKLATRCVINVLHIGYTNRDQLQLLHLHPLQTSSLMPLGSTTKLCHLRAQFVVLCDQILGK